MKKRLKTLIRAVVMSKHFMELLLAISKQFTTLVANMEFFV